MASFLQVTSGDFYSKGYSPTDPWTVACIRFGPTKRTRASGPRVRVLSGCLVVWFPHAVEVPAQFFGFSDPVTIALIRAMPEYSTLEKLMDKQSQAATGGANNSVKRALST